MKKKIFLLTVASLSIILLACSLNIINVAKADVIFGDSFQSDLSAWTNFRGTLSLNSEITATGVPYSVQSIIVGSTQGNLYYHILNSVTNPINLREYIYINSTTYPTTSGDYYEVGGFHASGGPNFGDGEICIINVAGTLYWGVYYRDLAHSEGFSFVISSNNSTSSAHPVSIGWTCIELSSLKGDTGQGNGYEQLYLNGSLIINRQNVYNYDRTPTGVVIGGSQKVTNPSETWNYYIDEVVVSSSYIGLVENLLTTSANTGTVSPAGITSYTLGTQVTITATAPTAGPGERYVFLGWTGSGVGSYTGSANPATVTMNGNITEAASWEHQYNLNVSSAYGTIGGAGWYGSGTSANATVSPLTVAGANGTQYVFTGWSGDASGTTSPSNGITMNGPKTVTANWKMQYSITVTSAHGNPTPSAWVDAGKDFSVSVTSPADTVAADHRFVCTGYSVDGGALTSGTSYNFSGVEAAHTMVFSWKQQFWVIFNQTGLPEGITAKVTIGSVTNTHTLPYSDWFDQGATVEFTYDDHMPSGFGSEYVASISNASPLTVGSSIDVKISYVKQTATEMYVVIAVPIILVCLLVAILLLRRRRKPPTSNA
jgi:uncharacterized repeat protein (TIGR02543 family)